MKQEVTQLDGYSGYDVLLIKKELNYRVRKKSKELKKNARLVAQYNKHLFFYKLKNALFSVPKVLGSGYEKKLFFYEYEYIEGITLINFIENNSVEKIKHVIDKIIQIIKELSDTKNEPYESDIDLSIKKALSKKISDNIKKCNLDNDICEKVNRRAGKLKNFSDKTLCHGDFTFDNIIIDSEYRIWLIDYLDNFYPHYWFDISKLFQDIDGKWYELKHGIKLPNNKLLYIRRYLLEEISKFDKEYIKHHKFLLAVVFLRILPYAKSKSDFKIILDKIKYFIN